MNLSRIAGSALVAAAATVLLAGQAAAAPAPASGEAQHLPAAAAAAPLDTPAFGTLDVHCGEGTFGQDGNQWYFDIACSPLGSTTQWYAYVLCADDNYYLAGPYDSFRNVRVYCPPGVLPQQGGVLHN